MKLTIKFLFAVLIVGYIACKQTEQVNPKAALMDEYLTAQAKYFKFNGNVLVAENGEIIFQKSYGYSDFDTKRMLNDTSVFELASVSKQFTATGILLLMDKGKLKLTDSLRQYFPELPYSNITIYHMLTHTSGLPDYMEVVMEKWDKSKVAFNNDVIQILAKEKLPVIFKPGEKWEYSNTAYMILASIVEKVSGQSFKDYMAANVFRPLVMTNTRIYNTRRSLKDTIPNYAFGYIYNDSLMKYILPDNDPNQNFVIYMDGIQGDGIVNSTTGDLLKWDRAVKNHTLLAESTQKEMLKGQSLSDTLNQSYYGFGVGISKTDLGNLISHSGGWPGYTTFLARNPDNDQTYIVLSNNNSNSPGISNGLQHIMAGKEVVMPYEHQEITVDSISLEPLIGTYKDKNEIKIEREGSTLKMVLSNGQTRELVAESTDKFFYNDGSDRQVEFKRGAAGKVISVAVINHGVKTVLMKK